MVLKTFWYLISFTKCPPFYRNDEVILFANSQKSMQGSKGKSYQNTVISPCLSKYLIGLLDNLSPLFVAQLKAFHTVTFQRFKYSYISKYYPSNWQTK